MNDKLLRAHKNETLFLHNMIMVSFAIFYEKFGAHENWKDYNKLIPYINENAINEAKSIIEC